jgi:hypothetical protein
MLLSISEARGAAASVFQLIDEVNANELTSNIDSNSPDTGTKYKYK